jgi:hypothetical protein
MTSKYSLVFRWALGDTAVVTALVRDIHKAYPDKFQVMPVTNWSPVWANNPYISKFDLKAKGPQPIRVQLAYRDGIRAAGRGEKVHFLRWLYRDFEKKTGLKVPVTVPKPDIHLTPKEKQPFVTSRYWVIISGGKLDITNKHWEVARYQQVVDTLNCYNVPCVQVGATHKNHVHPPLDNCLNLVGLTDNPRDLFSLIYNADGVICGVTGAMHIAAAFNKPCVVIAGGREEWWWEAYTNAGDVFDNPAEPVRVQHRFLHTLDQLYCCDARGCWKKRVVPINPQDMTKDKGKLCKEPVKRQGRQTVPKCMDMIEVDHVVEAVMSYYEDGTLPPVGESSGKYPLINGPQDPESPLESLSLIRLPEIGYSSTTREKAAQGRVVASSRPDLDVLRPFTAPIKPQKDVQKVLPSELDDIESPEGLDYSIMDHPIIGGKITFCTLCYGPHTDLAKRCIDSVLSTVPPSRLDLRVATNEAAPATVAYLKRLNLTKLYINTNNRMKYPVMRDMFWDEDNPITTSYVVWFDDDSFVVHPKWLTTLCQTIIQNHKHGNRLY